MRSSAFPESVSFIMSFDEFKFTDLFRSDVVVNDITEFRKHLFKIFCN